MSESIPGAAHREILGRGDERQQLARTLRGARETRGSAVVIRGEPGIGKSALLDDPADNAPDFCICRVPVVEPAMELPSSGLQRSSEPTADAPVDLDPTLQNP